MVKNHLMKFLVNEEQFLRIKNNASLAGYAPLSSFLRDTALNYNNRKEMTIAEIYNATVKKNKVKPKVKVEQANTLEIEIPEWIKVLDRELRK